MISASRLGYAAALLSLIFILAGLARMQGNETTSYLDRPFLVSSALESRSSFQVQNRTLGFERIFAISLPERTDKQDGMKVAASLSNLSVSFLAGIYGADVSPKARPFGFDRKSSVVGSWRAHMNVAAKMAEENIQSALIFEDDADWDVALKYQMVEFARGSRFLLNTPPRKEPISPYGDGWDMLWLGHCGTLEQRSDARRWIITDDATVTPSEFHRNNVDTPTLEPFGKEHTRMVFRSANGCCVTAYALSLSGARKSLNMMSLRAWNGPVDWGWNDLCKDGITNFICVSPFPQLFGAHRAAGNQSRWSDIETITGEDSVGKAHSLYLVFPTRLNIEALLTGGTRFHSQYGPEMELEDILKFQGHAEVASFELPIKPAA